MQACVWQASWKKINALSLSLKEIPKMALSPQVCLLCFQGSESALISSLILILWHRWLQLATTSRVPPFSVWCFLRGGRGGSCLCKLLFCQYLGLNYHKAIQWPIICSKVDLFSILYLVVHSLRIHGWWKDLLTIPYHSNEWRIFLSCLLGSISNLWANSIYSQWLSRSMACPKDHILMQS